MDDNEYKNNNNNNNNINGSISVQSHNQQAKLCSEDMQLNASNILNSIQKLSLNSNNNNNNHNNIDNDLKDPIGSNQTTKNDYNYLIKPVSLKTVKKISVAPSLTELDSFIGSTRPDMSSLLSPTNSTTSSQSFFFPSNNNFNSNYNNNNNKLLSVGGVAANTGEGYSNLKKSLIASNPAFTRFYNTPLPMSAYLSCGSYSGDSTSFQFSN